LKRRDLERHLRAHGARLLREGANHSVWGFDAERSTAVPRHREISFLLAMKICSDLGVPGADRLPLIRGTGSSTASLSADARASLPDGQCDAHGEPGGKQGRGPPAEEDPGEGHKPDDHERIR
jgi:hypothetical protein